MDGEHKPPGMDSRRVPGGPEHLSGREGHSGPGSKVDFIPGLNDNPAPCRPTRQQERRRFWSRIPAEHDPLENPMSNEFTLNAEVRADAGKGASRRLRHTARIPGIIYGGDKAPEMISLESRELVKALENEAFYSHILTINVGGKKQQAVIRDLQRHPAKGY